MREDGTIMRPIVTFIDAGFRPDSVRAFCAQYTHTPGVIDGVYPVFGRDDYVAKGRNYKIMPTDNGTPEIMINDQHFKRLVYAYIERENDYKRGYIHFPKDFSEEYFKGLTAEDMIETTTATGKTVYKIMNTKKRRNEPLDCQKMAYAALYFMCGEYYGAINKRRRASKKTEVPPDLDEFIKIMMPPEGEE
jgi:phage terminase large subunit GpA-like protein